jgi:hypothetical protein
MSRWFRLYDELLDDPKVQRLSGDDFKAWINLLCLASRKEGSLPPEMDIAFALRVDAKKGSAIVARLVSAGLFDDDGGRFVPHGWNTRQYKSDVSTGRVKRFRERSKTVAATPPDTEAETEVALAKANASENDADKQFWDGAKAYLGKGKASLIGQWVGRHGREATAAAIAAAQVERAVDPVAFIQGRFRKIAAPVEGPLC